MQLYAVALSGDGGPDPRLAEALAGAAAAFPQLDASTLEVARSRSGAVQVGWISHAQAVAGPRRYAARRGDELALVDGFPVERSGRFAAHDAGALLDHWHEAPGEVEGVFSAVRVDLAADAVEVLLDVLGIAPVFGFRSGTTQFVANSVELLRALGASGEPDPLGVGSLLALGWPAGGRTLVRDVRFLEPGALHRLSPRGRTTTPYLTPASVLGTAASSSAEMVERLRSTTKAAADSGVALTSALSSGRDTRVLLALLHAAAAEHRTRFYTSGMAGDLDLTVSGEIADRWGLERVTHLQEPPPGAREWREQTSAFIARGDGMASIDSISDHLAHEDLPHAELPLELWGAGGEIGRKVKWVGSSLGGLTPLVKRLDGTQRRLLHRSADDGGGLLTPAATSAALGYVDEFLAARRAEGWPAEHAVDLFYAFARVRHWAARGVRRAAAHADLFSPFISRAYIEHCLRLPVGARYVEQPPRRLIDALWPEVDADRYEFAWRPQLPRAAFGLVLAEAARRVALRARDRPVSADAVVPLGLLWFEAGLPVHRELAAGVPDSPIWAYVDRDRYARLLAATPAERAPHASALNRVLTVLWYLHGPAAGR